MKVTKGLILMIGVIGLLFLVSDLRAASLDSLKKEKTIEALTKAELDGVRSRISYQGPGKLDPEILNDKNLSRLLSGEPLLIIGPEVWEFGIKNIVVVTRLAYQVNYIYKLDEHLILTMEKTMIGPTRTETSWWATMLVGLILLVFLFFIITTTISGRIKK